MAPGASHAIETMSRSPSPSRSTARRAEMAFESFPDQLLDKISAATLRQRDIRSAPRCSAMTRSSLPSPSISATERLLSEPREVISCRSQLNEASGWARATKSPRTVSARFPLPRRYRVTVAVEVSRCHPIRVIHFWHFRDVSSLPISRTIAGVAPPGDLFGFPVEATRSIRPSPSRSVKAIPSSEASAQMRVLGQGLSIVGTVK